MMNAVFSSRQSAFTCCSPALKVRAGHKWTMMKKDIHPKYYDEAKVFCNGVEVMTLGGVKPEYHVDIYSGNHPFYLGVKTTLVVDEGQVNKFKKRFEGLDDLADTEASARTVAGGGKDDDLNFDKKMIVANKPKKKK